MFNAELIVCTSIVGVRAVVGSTATEAAQLPVTMPGLKDWPGQRCCQVTPEAPRASRCPFHGNGVGLICRRGVHQQHLRTEDVRDLGLTAHRRGTAARDCMMVPAPASTPPASARLRRQGCTAKLPWSE